MRMRSELSVNSHPGATRQLSIRLPLELIEAIGRRHEGTTTNFVVQAIRERLVREREEEIAVGLATLANDDETNDLSEFAAAQDRVIVRGG